ncbi:AbrB family transcriptional regulator [Paracoccus rhizosphaerae]|uniref:AbrB family transcriptional regulator n=1 Tax=Paracoccus rhizosphaerae TaxID=1133347 RepID=A0ABV6CGC9_9RHOB|nr:AbrB family transcriptional regulator [Paracoccus rhizosphaerae]
MSRLPASVRSGATLLAAGLAGWLCDALHVPLGWLIGAMLVMIVASLARIPAQQPVLIVPYVKASVGTLLGASITMPVLLSVPEWWVSLSFMLVVMAVAGALNYRLLQRHFGFAPADAALCSVPGGIAEMIFLSDQAGADQRRVAIVHALRIALSILVIPPLVSLLYGITISRAAPIAPVQMTWPDWGWFAFCILAGVAAARSRRLPAPLIIVPMTVCAALHVTGFTHFVVPPEVSRIMQVVIGLNVGARFQNQPLSSLVRVFGAALSTVAVQIAFALLGAFVVLHLTGFDQLALTLAYAPGGLAEMSLIAIAMGREVAFVGLHHLVRVLLSLGLAPVLLRKLKGNEQCRS